MDDAPEPLQGELHHGTAVALRLASGPRAALIRGPSGAGKSDLALRCLAWPGNPLVPETAVLVSDDQVLIDLREGRLHAAAPAAIRGRIEVRGLGILEVDATAAELVLIVDLVERSAVPRLPDPVPRGHIGGMELPILAVHAFDATAPLKLLIALREPHWDQDGGTIPRSRPRA